MEMSLSEVQAKPIISQLQRGQVTQLHPSIQELGSDLPHHAEGSCDPVTRKPQTGQTHLITGPSPNQALTLVKMSPASDWSLLSPTKNIFQPILCRAGTEAA